MNITGLREIYEWKVYNYYFFFRSITQNLPVNMVWWKKQKWEIWLLRSSWKVKECSYPDSSNSDSKNLQPDGKYCEWKGERFQYQFQEQMMK